MQEGRWVAVTPSQFQHEREALAYLQKLLPDTEPYRAWANFTFTAGTGAHREVDLLVAAPSGLHLIEIKSLNGKLTSSGNDWILIGQNGKTRTFDNPVHLANSKAKELKSLLQKAAAKRKVTEKIPFVRASVFLSVKGLKVELADYHRHDVYGPTGHSSLSDIWDELLKKPPVDEYKRLKPTLAKQLPALLKEVGIARTRKHYQVGQWQLEPKPWDSTDTWQDHLARHADLPQESRRVRIYLVERNADPELRESIERAAKREMLALHGISHPGIVQVDTLEHHDAGPALIFRHDPRTIRLDHYLTQYGSQLTVEERVAMIRQLAEAVRYAHTRRLYHRALSARSVLVRPRRVKGRSGEDGWLKPILMINDWHTATRDIDASRTTEAPGSLVRNPTAHPELHSDAAARAYLAPELNTGVVPDPVALDVFGLGMLAYLLLTGKAPAASRQELLSRLSQEQSGLRPSSVADSISEYMDEMVQAATAPIPAQRDSSVDQLLENLQLIEFELEEPEPSISDEGTLPTQEADPLEAERGTIVGGEWKISQRLGTGSTSRVFLAENLASGKEEVLKVALSDEKASSLVREAEVLRRLGNDNRIIKLVRREPLQIGDRTVLVLGHAGKHTVARKIREDGRLTPDELETYSHYMFGAIDFLEGEGVTHRDIKPDNIAIRTRPNGTRQLVLFDFSLAGIPVQNIEAGTPGYLDPFLGVKRQTYDGHAERYAIAATLHEMASGELPQWGDGKTAPMFTGEPTPHLAAEAFDPALRDALVEFFEQALHSDAGKRFDGLKEMRTAWHKVFVASEAVPAKTGSSGLLPPDAEAGDNAQRKRDAAAAKATLETALQSAGLTERAVSACARFGLHAVGDLLASSAQGGLFNLPGVGAKTRKELQTRNREWRLRLQPRHTSPVGDVVVAKAEASATEQDGEQALARAGLDTIAVLLIPTPQKNGRNATEIDTTRLLLGLPATDGTTSPWAPWPMNRAVAERLPITAGRVAQILGAQRIRWRKEPLVRSVLEELIEVLAANGRVMTALELAEALLSRRGSTSSDQDVRRALAAAAVRAAVESEDSDRLVTRRHGDDITVALEAADDDAPDTPAGPALLDYADKLGVAADRLAGADPLPTPATVLRELHAVHINGIEHPLEDRRLVFLAAAASTNAAANARLEIYPRDLSPVRALRLAQAGVVPVQRAGGPQSGLTRESVDERVRARFPALAPLPRGPRLDRLLREAGFDLVWEHGRYRSRLEDPSSTGIIPPRRPTGVRSSRWTATTPEVADALSAEEKLKALIEAKGVRGGWRAMSVQASLYERARLELVNRFGAKPLNVSALFLTALRNLLVPGELPEWSTLLEADLAPSDSEDALYLRQYMAEAWQIVGQGLFARLAAEHGPLLLHDGAPFFKYEAGAGRDLLFEVAHRARSGEASTWLLCPMENPEQQPRLDGHLVPAELPTEWIYLPSSWAENTHRSESTTR